MLDDVFKAVDSLRNAGTDVLRKIPKFVEQKLRVRGQHEEEQGRTDGLLGFPENVEEEERLWKLLGLELGVSQTQCWCLGH